VGERQRPDGLLIAYGHVGDGNLHFNVSAAPGAPRERFLAREEPVRRAIHDLASEFGGSFSAEHGIGDSRSASSSATRPPVELALMRAVKHAFDPHGIMNPGKVLREHEGALLGLRSRGRLRLAAHRRGGLQPARPPQALRPRRQPRPRVRTKARASPCPPTTCTSNTASTDTATPRGGLVQAS